MLWFCWCRRPLRVPTHSTACSCKRDSGGDVLGSRRFQFPNLTIQALAVLIGGATAAAYNVRLKLIASAALAKEMTITLFGVKEIAKLLGTDLQKFICFFTIQQNNLQANCGFSQAQFAAKNTNIFDNLRHLQVCGNHFFLVIGSPLYAVSLGDEGFFRNRVARNCH